MLVGMLEVGEESGGVPEMLAQVSQAFEEEVDTAVDSLTSLIEPVMIILLAGLVGTIVVALFLPLISMLKIIGT
jgi:type IV pilus assembly protein PilC